MTAELQRAISSRAFIYHFQPQIELESGEIVGAETLIRWLHTLFGLQQPTRFLALPEETGLILDIKASGFRKVIEFAASLNRTRKKPLGLSFDVSSIEITHRDMVSLDMDTSPRPPAPATAPAGGGRPIISQACCTWSRILVAYGVAEADTRH